jgi:dienelactone hydrolase
MLAPLAKLMDWSAIQIQSLWTPPANGRNPRLEEALHFLRGPDFIPGESHPAPVEFDGPLHFRFPSPRPGDYTENNTVYGRLYRCGEHWQEQPVIVLLHGWNSVLSHRLRFPLIARRCNQAGFNAATLVAPYHFQRRPRQPGALSGPDYLRLAERTAQAIAEIRALTGWLLGEGCPAIALWGGSYGGWLAGLTACRDARLAAVVMAVPRVGIKNSRAERVIWRRSREMLQSQRVAMEMLDTTSLNLTTTQPAIPKERILLIEASHDLFTPKEPIEELWEKWGQPDIWRLPHGHFSFSLVGAPCLMTSRVLCWLSPRLNKPAVTYQKPPGEKL